MLLKYVSLNIRSMIKNHLGIFLLIIISEMIAVLCLFFSYGLFFNTRETVGKIESDRFVYNYELPDTPNIKTAVASLADALGDDLASFDLYIACNTENGERVSGVVFYNAENDGDVHSADNDFSCRLDRSLESLVKNGKIILGGSLFTAQLEMLDYVRFIIPIGSLTDGFSGKSLILYVKEQPTVEGISRMNGLCSELLGAKCVAAPEASKLMEVQLNNSFYVYSFLIVVLVLINLSMYFRYVLGLRSKQMRIMMICGGTSPSIAAIYIFEALAELLFGFACAFLIYKYILLDIAAGFYPNFPSYYSAKTYLMILAVYIAASVLVLAFNFVPFIKRTVSAGERRD